MIRLKLILALILWVSSDKTTKEYKILKGLKKENLRDNIYPVRY
jgi:hypothetical protein